MVGSGMCFINLNWVFLISLIIIQIYFVFEAHDGYVNENIRIGCI